MLLSFSIHYMRPMIEAGFRQYSGETVTERVKRQTIRALGPRTRALLAEENPATRLDLDLWWKSRTPARAFIGKVEQWTIAPISITNDGGILLVKKGTFRLNKVEIDDLAIADGFPSRVEFYRHFVPNGGDVFQGGLFRW